MSWGGFGGNRAHFNASAGMRGCLIPVRSAHARKLILVDVAARHICLPEMRKPSIQFAAIAPRMGCSRLFALRARRPCRSGESRVIVARLMRTRTHLGYFQRFALCL